MLPTAQLLRGEAPATLDQPLDHLMACHRRIEDRLETLERIAELIEDRPQDCEAALAKVLAFLDTNGRWHTEDEEQSVFPRLRTSGGAEAEETLGQLEHEHREADAILADLRESAGNPGRFRERVNALCAIYRAHIRREDERLIPLGRTILSPGDLAAISAEMRQRRSM